MKFAPYAVLAWVLAALLGGELALELRARARGYGTLLFGPPATAVQPMNGEFGRTADFPFRSRKVSVEHDPGTTRIWLASASYAEDILVPVERIWPVLLEDELLARGHRVEVLNASRGGIRLSDSSRELAELGPVWTPDLAVAYHLSNDVDFAVDAPGPTATEVLDAGKTDSRPWPTRLAHRTTAYAQATNLLGTRVEALVPSSDEAPLELERLLTENLQRFARTAESVGARPLVSTLPIGQPALDEPLPEEWAHALRLSHPGLSTRGWLVSLEVGNQRIRDVAYEEGLPLLDMAAQLNGQSELFDDSFHYTDEGHRVVARTFADLLEPILEEHLSTESVEGQ